MEENLQYYNSSFYDTENTHDPIWGSIRLSVFEMRLINTPEFQRLRRIKQLGFVNLVYPAAEHSRFVHSIGVCYHAKKLVDQLNENFKRVARYRAWRNLGINDSSTAPIYDEVKVSAIEKIIIAAAALLHDLPHSPFSHEIESPNGNPLTGIPNHDDFDKNPVLFKYLFDTEHSRLAEILTLYNEEFWQLLQLDKNWFGRIESKALNFKSTFSTDGYVNVSPDSIINSNGAKKYQRLPILGVMIFELHLFEKPEHWVKDYKPADARKVQTEWEDSEQTILNWKPVAGWFRPYRKDIVGNTICADLIDYIERDGKQTGIIATIDLKFLDRMTISRAIPEQGKATELKVNWKVIPDYCEHIVFDIFDHKRGFVRESVITEILSCLQARYQLTERVYNHRVVEGARSMLQEISRLLCSIEVLNIKILHTINGKDSNCPTGDDTFLSWVIDTKQRLADHKDPSKKNNILAAAKLAQALKERRIYREAVIIDGIHGYTSGSLAGGESNCKSLENILLSDEKDISEKRNQMLADISNQLKTTYESTFGEKIEGFEQLATIGARKFGKKYKVPRVLVAKPYSNESDDNINIDIQPLFACEDPLHIRIQLNAMINAYHGLWRVYLFIHPAFHWNKQIGESKIFVDLHREIERSFIGYANSETPIHWKNSIDFKKLLPNVPIDYVEFIEHFEKATDPKIEKIEAKEVVINGDDELKLIVDALIAEVFSPANNLKPLKGKEKESFYELVLTDKEMKDHVLDSEKRANISNLLPQSYFQNENRSGTGEAKILFAHIKKIIEDGKKLF